MAKKKAGVPNELLQLLQQALSVGFGDEVTLDELAVKVQDIPVNARLEWWVGVGQVQGQDLPGDPPTLVVVIDLARQAGSPLLLEVLEEGGAEGAYAALLELMLDPQEGEAQAPGQLYTPEAQTAFALGNVLRDTNIKVQHGGPPELQEFLQMSLQQMQQQFSLLMQASQPLPFLRDVPDEHIQAFGQAFGQFMQRRTWEILEPDQPLYAQWVNPDGSAGQTYATVMGEAGQSYGVSFFPDWLKFSVYVQNVHGPDDMEAVLAYTGGMEAVSGGQEREFHPDDWAMLKRLKLVQRGTAPSLLNMGLDGMKPARTPLHVTTAILNVLNERAGKRRTPVTSLKGVSDGVQVQYPATARDELTEAELSGSVELQMHHDSPRSEERLHVQAPASMLISQWSAEVKKQLLKRGGKEAEYVMPFSLYLSGEADADRQGDPSGLMIWDSGNASMGMSSATLAHLARLGRVRGHFTDVQATLRPEPVPSLTLKYEVLRAPEVTAQKTAKTASRSVQALVPSSAPNFGDGMCKACGYVGNKASMTKHQAKCAGRQGGPTDVYRLRVTADGPYFLDLDVKADATLNDIDRFLRGIWLECCGHMSEFSIGPQLDYDSPVLSMKKPRQPPLHTLLKVGQKFRYTYDMGTSTELDLTVQARENVTAFGGPVRLLARNFAPEFECAHPNCAQTAKWANSWEYDDRGLPVMHCTKHMDKEAKADGAYLPIVNSPRMGECAYEGGNDDGWPKGSVPLPQG